MPYITCMVCGNGAIQPLDISICPHCLDRKDDKTRILAIQKYLERYPNAKLPEVASALKIDKATMDRFLEEGSLQLMRRKDGSYIVNIEEKNIDPKEERRKKLIQQLQNASNSNNGIKNFGQSQLLRDLERRKGEDNQR